MTTTLIVTSLCLLLVGALVGVMAVREARVRHWLGGTIRGLVAPQRFRATITLPDRRLAMYELAGDAFYVDAHVLKWHPWASLLGLRTVYELDRVAGRYK